MKKQFVKKIRDNIPESLKNVSAPFFRNRLINNKEFCRYYDLLKNRESLSSEEIAEYQLNELKRVLVYSYNYVPYYQDLFNKIAFNPYKISDFYQIEKIPYLTRQIVKENFDKLISTKKVKNGYYTGSTGGSSGLPLTFYLDYDSIFKENAFIYYYRSRLGYSLNDRVVTFKNLRGGDKLWKNNPMHNEVMFSNTRLSKITIEKYAKMINAFQPHYLNGYLSSIWYFAKLLEEHKIKINSPVKGIFLISENVDIEQRNFIEQFFNTRSITFYGHSERCVIAEEKIPNRYMFDPYYGYTELKASGENRYSIVSTGFLNQIMPFIRYLTDDECYSDGKYYAIDGKRCSSIGLVGKNNEFLPALGFVFGVNFFKNVLAHQYVQHEKGKAEMLIIVNGEFRKEELVTMKKEIDFHNEGIIDMEIKVVDDLILSPRGKFQRVISCIEEDKTDEILNKQLPVGIINL